MRSQGHSDAVVLQFARQDSFVELVKVNELDQVGEFGVPVVKAEEHLPVILALEGHKNTRRVRGHTPGDKEHDNGVTARDRGGQVGKGLSQVLPCWVAISTKMEGPHGTFQKEQHS